MQAIGGTVINIGVDIIYFSSFSPLWLIELMEKHSYAKTCDIDDCVNENLGRIKLGYAPKLNSSRIL